MASNWPSTGLRVSRVLSCAARPAPNTQHVTIEISTPPVHRISASSLVPTNYSHAGNPAQRWTRHVESSVELCYSRHREWVGAVRGAVTRRFFMRKSFWFAAGSRSLMFLGVLWALGVVTPVVAHHAFSAEFDANTPIKLQATVTELEW